MQSNFSFECTVKWGKLKNVNNENVKNCFSSFFKTKINNNQVKT